MSKSLSKKKIIVLMLSFLIGINFNTDNNYTKYRIIFNILNWINNQINKGDRTILKE